MSDPTEVEQTDSFCQDCLSLMVEDRVAGFLCPTCDEHPAMSCGEFPCSGGFGAGPCVLNKPIDKSKILLPPSDDRNGGAGE